ncbi:hypothetical protein COT30_02105 [Candidatus Micrarchaeota archaeon CG08_land_8_20_14_0_20_49_17]|nr:MAG: hypothetical protein AUJ13_02070 [Candidatus Micrarchaeota archaeon CG1_02_49_24]PIU09882.1 MAG: hypothetical protein COT30_02105 [Candidatus Micrarchaeota archaeon CG08_land_8_20_14_0_20_49_17]PIZ93035.1 MAG: hypothetical protein COX84_06305 [Candidatus Micrarchaeota archaeon CG_4_10_14_0_2_um_filter_49_7]HII53579.1 hypothetical protein [Candidatus Micrarchaeota archaeon]
MVEPDKTNDSLPPSSTLDEWHKNYREALLNNRKKLLREIITQENACNKDIVDLSTQPAVAEEENKKTEQTEHKNFQPYDINASDLTMVGVQVDLTPKDGNRITYEFGNAVIDGRVTNDIFSLRDGYLSVSSSGRSVSNEPAIGIIERENELIVLAELPNGISGKISAEATGRELKLTSSDGLFNRCIRLPNEIPHGDEPLVQVKDGILEITLKK